MAETEQATPEVETNETDIEVTDLDTFVRLLASWHGKRVARLQELMNTPAGTEITIGEEPPVVLDGETLRAFRLGVAMALSQLGDLPFGVEFEAPAEDAKPH